MMMACITAPASQRKLSREGDRCCYAAACRSGLACPIFGIGFPLRATKSVLSRRLSGVASRACRPIKSCQGLDPTPCLSPSLLRLWAWSMIGGAGLSANASQRVTLEQVHRHTLQRAWSIARARLAEGLRLSQCPDWLDGWPRAALEPKDARITCIGLHRRRFTAQEAR